MSPHEIDMVFGLHSACESLGWVRHYSDTYHERDGSTPRRDKGWADSCGNVLIMDDEMSEALGLELIRIASLLAAK